MKRNKRGSSFVELRRHHCVLASKKVNILKNQQLFLDLQDRGGHRQTTALKIGETDRQIQGVMAYQSRDSQVETTSETSAGKGNLNCN